MREQRVALEDRVDRALVRLAVGDVLAADQDAAGGRRLEAGHQAQGRGLAAAGRSEQREERPGRDREVEVLDRGEAGEPLGDADQFEVGAGVVEGAGHQAPSASRLSGIAAVKVCSWAGVSVRKMCAFFSVSASGKISWLSARSGSIFDGGLLGAVDRRDVVHVGRDLRPRSRGRSTSS